MLDSGKVVLTNFSSWRSLDIYFIRLIPTWQSLIVKDLVGCLVKGVVIDLKC